jgi:hypothetical protein
MWDYKYKILKIIKALLVYVRTGTAKYWTIMWSFMQFIPSARVL